jgi:hypothetical protein
MPAVHALDPMVAFRDPGLEAAVRDALGQPEGAIRQHKVQTIAKLFASGYGITDLEGIQHLRNLASLNLRDNEITSIEPLRNLNTLRELNLRDNKIRDLDALNGLAGLVYLNIHSNPIDHGLEVLANLRDLQTLIMRNVSIGDSHLFLTNLLSLQNLNIRNTSITDLSSIAVLMDAGALQDDKPLGIKATLNILENDPLPTGEGIDPYDILVPYWDNIANRYPFTLPYFPGGIDAPLFSHESGFYQNSFHLTLSANEPGEKIYYTLDGSEPSPAVQNDSGKSTFAYTTSIPIKNKAGEPNQFANIDTSHPGLYDYSPPPDIFKATVVRAIVVGENGERSSIATHTYFVEEQINDRYTFPIVSIATHPEGLFDDDSGIYVPGDLFQRIAHPNENPANYTQRGMKWEKPANIQIFSPDGKTILAQNAGIRIHGEATRWYAQKSLRLIARREYDPQTSFDFDFFPTLKNRLNDRSVNSFHTLILRNSGQDCFTNMFQDAMAHTLLEHTSLDIQGSLPVVVFINGEYWGIHNVRTRYDKDYFQSYYGIEEQDLAVLKNDLSLSIGTKDDVEHFREILNLIDPQHALNGYRTASTLSDPDVYADVASMMDIDNFIDVYTSQIYFKNTDWPGNNMVFWRKKVEEPKPALDVPYGHDGKWRWALTDTDFGFDRPDHNTLFDATRDDGTDWYNEPWSTYLIRSLLQNDTFRNSFINRFADHLNTSFREEVVVDQIDRFEEVYLPEMQEHIQRWGPQERSFETWRAYVEGMRSFALFRPDQLRQHIIDHFSLPGISTITLLSDSQKGHIRINEIDIKTGTPGVADTDRWSGIYFQGVPVRLSAVPNPGYRFAGWKGIDQAGPEVVLILESDLEIEALFSPVNP